MTQAGGGGRQPNAASLQVPANVRRAEDSGKKTAMVYVVSAAYQTMASDSAPLSHDFYLVGAGVGAGGARVGLYAATQSEVLDVDEVATQVLIPVAGGPEYVAVGDHWLLASFRWWLTINGAQPWDQFTITAAGRTVGWQMLNQNVLASWSAAPIHLAVLPGQVLELWCASNIAMPAGALVMSRLRGRHVAYARWKDVTEKNSIQGGA